MRRVRSTNEVELAVYDLGGDGPPLVLSHATGFHGRVWLPLASRLADAFHCYAFDSRGHGDSSPPLSAGYRWRGFGEDVLAVVDGLILDRPYGVGHSAGAAALLMAEQDRPGTFRALYCYEPVVLPADPPPGPGENALSRGALRRRDRFPSKAEAFANFAGKRPFSQLQHDVLEAYVEHGFEADPQGGGVRLKCRPEDEAETYRMSFAHDAFPRFGEVRCPVVIACGEKTDAFGPALVERQAAALPDARTEVLPGLGHFGPLQDPFAVADAIRRAFGA